MDSINKKNSYLLCSVLLLMLHSFICCQKNENDIQNKFLQDSKTYAKWECVPKEECWYYSKYKNKQLLDDGTKIKNCSSDGKKIVCPSKIYGNRFCQEVQNLTGSECKIKRACWHYNTTVNLPGYKHGIRCSHCEYKMCCVPKWAIKNLYHKTFEEASQNVREKCNEYNEQIYEEHDVNSQNGNSSNSPTSIHYIVRGMNAEKKEFPHMALIGYLQDDKMQWNCGGSLISEKFVLSAAHCATNTQGTQAHSVLLGTENFRSIHKNTNAAYYTIVETFIYPDYDSKMRNHNIILFQLNDIVEFNAYIRPICLSTSSFFLPTHSTAVVSGYGRPDTGMARTGALMKANVTILDNEQCISSFNRTDKYPLGINKDTILCARSNGDNGKYVCYGDGGSPLQTLNGEGLWELHGIVSCGRYFCSDNKYPEVIYTRVSYYIVWIESIVWSLYE